MDENQVTLRATGCAGVVKGKERRLDPTYWLTEEHTVRYAQKREKSGFVNNMTTVLPASGRAELHAQTFLGSPELFCDPLGSQNAQNGETAA